MRSKKCTSLFLAILFLVSNLGLAFNVHYCGDKIASISSAFKIIESSKKLNGSQENCCCKKEDIAKDSCCKNKVVDLKKNAKDVVIKAFSCQIQVPFILNKSTELFFARTERVISIDNVTEYYCGPNELPLFKLYKQYLFYA